MGRFRFLTGVFLGPSTPTPPAPPRLDDLTASSPSLTPQLQQSFFIGDGLTGLGSGTRQTFIVPRGGTRLFLGFLDGSRNRAGRFGNNSGALTVTVETR